MEIRAATEADLPEIQAIYAHHVLHGAGTFEETPPSIEEMTERFQAITSRGWTFIAATDDTGVIGYAYFSQLRDRSAYRFSAEDSIYVRDDVRGQGVGKALVARLLTEAEAAGFRQMFAVIGDSDNVGSIGMHASLGFQRIGMLRASGFKFGRWDRHRIYAAGRWAGGIRIFQPNCPLSQPVAPGTRPRPPPGPHGLLPLQHRPRLQARPGMARRRPPRGPGTALPGRGPRRPVARSRRDRPGGLGFPG